MMNKDPGTLEEILLAWLMQAPIPHEPLADGANLNRQTGSIQERGNHPELPELDRFDSEALDALAHALGGLKGSTQPLKLGDIPAVQDRFHALLKRRLQAEIQHHPPLFPWETELSDYAARPTEFPLANLIPTPVWTAQLQNLNLPVPLPEKVLAPLLSRCQHVLQSSLQEGAKLVRAVEELFPGQSHSLNQLAGLVLMSPSRSPRSQQLTFPPETEFPTSYEAATSTQQMLLSLLAAREIIGSLTLTVSPSQPSVERQWLTAAGLLSVQAAYQQRENSTLTVQCEVPCGGSLKLKGGKAAVAAQCSNAGSLNVEVSHLSPNQIYSLEVQLQDPDQQPLVFAIHPTLE